MSEIVHLVLNWPLNFQFVHQLTTKCITLCIFLVQKHFILGTNFLKPEYLNNSHHEESKQERRERGRKEGRKTKEKKNLNYLMCLFPGSIITNPYSLK